MLLLIGKTTSLRTLDPNLNTSNVTVNLIINPSLYLQ